MRTDFIGVPKKGFMYLDHRTLNPMLEGWKLVTVTLFFFSISAHKPSEPRCGQLAPPNAKMVVCDLTSFLPKIVSKAATSPCQPTHFQF